MSANVRKHLFISGRVQGVGFRAFIKREATKRQVKGWAKNLSDGQVEAVLCGEKKQVKELLHKLEDGPAFARVTDIEVKDEEYWNEFDNFRIKY